VDNINLHPALLSRFDLIYIILDIPNKKLDTKLAQHILNIYSGKNILEKKYIVLLYK
jgi:DNA replicative helicase MCM subunit Mcm2 (Cdc46/Mcm family)